MTWNMMLGYVRGLNISTEGRSPLLHKFIVDSYLFCIVQSMS